jgi:ketosteroid isomerase-like protein
MGHPNEDLVRRGYDAFSRGEMDTFRELLHPDIVWHAPGRSRLAGDHKGVDAVIGYFGDTMKETGGTFTVELRRVIADDTGAVGVHGYRAERNGRTIRDDSTLVFSITDGRVTEVQQYVFDLYAFDELLG